LREVARADERAADAGELRVAQVAVAVVVVVPLAARQRGPRARGEEVGGDTRIGESRAVVARIADEIGVAVRLARIPGDWAVVPGVGDPVTVHVGARVSESRAVLRDREELPGCDVVPLLHGARGPLDAQCVDRRGVAQAELGIQALLVLLSVAARDLAE